MGRSGSTSSKDLLSRSNMLSLLAYRVPIFQNIDDVSLVQRQQLQCCFWPAGGNSADYRLPKHVTFTKYFI